MPTHKNKRDMGSGKVIHYTFVCLWSERTPLCSSPWSRALQEDTWGCSRLWASGQSILLGLERSDQIWLPCSLDGSVAPVRSDCITLKNTGKKNQKSSVTRKGCCCWWTQIRILLLKQQIKVSCFVLSPTMEWCCHVNISKGRQTFNFPRITQYRIQPPSYSRSSKIPHILLKYTAVTVKKWRWQCGLRAWSSNR